LRIKEQEKRLTLNEHDDDDEILSYHKIQFLISVSYNLSQS